MVRGAEFGHGSTLARAARGRGTLRGQLGNAGRVRLPVMPPVAPMLAKAADELPEGDGWIYEPKWDGFRCIVFRDGDEVELGSRNERPLTRYFPEVVAAVCSHLPARCVIDGEILIPGETGLDFDALLQRIHPADSRVRKLAAETPGVVRRVRPSRHRRS